MRIGVTGSSGLIGSALVTAARERGDDVVCFVRPTSAPASGSVIRWDPSTAMIDETDLKTVGGLDAIVHLAGAGIADRRWSDDRKREILDSRVRSTELLGELIANLPSGCAMVASGSAIGIYGSRGSELLDESSSLGHDFLAGVCVQWEAATANWAVKDVKMAYLRTGIVMSSRGGALKRQLPLFRMGLGGRLSTGGQWLSPISLSDQIRAILWILDRGLIGPHNLTSPNPITNAQFTNVLSGQLHRPGVTRVPRWALQLVLGSQLASEAVLASQRVRPTRLLDSGFQFEHIDCPAIVNWAIQNA